jgi:hypothetical protein
MARFTIYFAMDIHGSETCFRKFLNAGAFYGVDALVLGGDVAGKGLIPIVQDVGGVWETTLFGKPVRLGSDDDLAEFERRMRLQGFYPYRTTTDEAAELAKHSEALDRAFERAIGKSIATSTWQCRPDAAPRPRVSSRPTASSPTGTSTRCTVRVAWCSRPGRATAWTC